MSAAEWTATEPTYETCPRSGESGWHVTVIDPDGVQHGHVFDDRADASLFAHRPYRWRVVKREEADQ